MRVLHLVLHCEKEPYTQMAKITQPWYKQFEEKGVDTYYYYFDPSVNSITLDGIWLRIPGQESFIPGILDKTLEALRYFFAEQQECKYDYVLRTNDSSVANLTQWLATVSGRAPVMYGGALIMETNNVGEADGNVEAKYYPLRFVHGASILLHRTAVRMLLTHVDRINRKTIDDITLGVFFKELSLSDKTCNWEAQQAGFQFAGIAPHFNIDMVSTFRNQNFHTDRSFNIEMMTQQVEALFNRYMVVPNKLPIVKVMYHDQDITKQVLLLAKAGGEWRMFCTNERLDFLFGDPAPGVLKNLYLHFANGLIVQQAANWGFYYDRALEKLLVR